MSALWEAGVTVSETDLPDNPLDQFTLGDDGELKLSRRDDDRVLQRAFLKSFAAVGRAHKNCILLGIPYPRYLDWVKHDALFREALQHAREDRLHRLEQELYRRALRGVPRKKFNNGDPVIDPETGMQYVEYDYSDRLLELALRAEDPEKYRDKKVEHTGEVHHDHQHAGFIRVIEDGDWYGNAHRLSAADAPASVADPAVTGPVQSPVVRATIRENGSGVSGMLEGPRPEAPDI